MKKSEAFWRGVRLDLKLIGWVPAAGSALALTFFFVLFEVLARQGGEIDWGYPRRAIEVIVPLAFALQAASVLGPDNEPSIELLLTSPRPLARLLRDRLLLVAAEHALIALTATLVFTAAWGTESLGLALVRWIAASVFLGGLAVFTTQVTRQGAFGALMATMMWASSLYGGDGLLKRWEWAWPVHVYLQPEKFTLAIYLINRLTLLAIGLALFLLAARLFRDEERTLGIR